MRKAYTCLDCGITMHGRLDTVTGVVVPEDRSATLVTDVGSFTCMTCHTRGDGPRCGGDYHVTDPGGPGCVCGHFSGTRTPKEIRIECSTCHERWTTGHQCKVLT